MQLLEGLPCNTLVTQCLCHPITLRDYFGAEATGDTLHSDQQPAKEAFCRLEAESSHRIDAMWHTTPPSSSYAKERCLRRICMDYIRLFPSDELNQLKESSYVIPNRDRTYQMRHQSMRRSLQGCKIHIRRMWSPRCNNNVNTVLSQVVILSIDQPYRPSRCH